MCLFSRFFGARLNIIRTGNTGLTKGFDVESERRQGCLTPKNGLLVVRDRHVRDPKSSPGVEPCWGSSLDVTRTQTQRTTWPRRDEALNSEFERLLLENKELRKELQNEPMWLGQSFWGVPAFCMLFLAENP